MCIRDRAVLGKLRGPAKDSTYGKSFANIEELRTHLKKRFAPGRGFSYYMSKLGAIRMRQGDSVGTFRDQINILLSCAEAALKEEKKADNSFKKEMMTPLEDTAVDTFIKGLPGNLSQLVDLSKPADLEAAYDEAVRLEARMDAHIVPDSRLRGGYRVMETPRRENRSGQKEKMAYVGWVQETEPTDEWIESDPGAEYGDPWEEWQEGPSPGQDPIGEIYYQQATMQHYQPKSPQPPVNGMGQPLRTAYQRPTNPPYQGYQNYGPNYGPRPNYRPNLLQRPKTYDPDRYAQRGNLYGHPRYAGPQNGPRMGMMNPQRPPGQQMAQRPPMLPQVQCQPIMEDISLRPTPQYQQALNYQQARPTRQAASQNDSRPAPPTPMAPPHSAQTLQIQAQGTPTSTLRIAKTLQCME